MYSFFSLDAAVKRTKLHLMLLVPQVSIITYFSSASKATYCVSYICKQASQFFAR